MSRQIMWRAAAFVLAGLAIYSGNIGLPITFISQQAATMNLFFAAIACLFVSFRHLLSSLKYGQDSQSQTNDPK